MNIFQKVGTMIRGTIVVAFLVISLGNSSLGCSSSSRYTADGKKIMMFHFRSCIFYEANDKSSYIIVHPLKCFYSFNKESTILEDPECRHGEHYDDYEKACKCGKSISCERSDKSFCIDGQCKGYFV